MRAFPLLAAAALLVLAAAPPVAQARGVVDICYALTPEPRVQPSGECGQGEETLGIRVTAGPGGLSVTVYACLPRPVTSPQYPDVPWPAEGCGFEVAP